MMFRAESMVHNAVEDLMVHGMTKKELEALMQRVFQKADLDKCVWEQSARLIWSGNNLTGCRQCLQRRSCRGDDDKRVEALPRTSWMTPMSSLLIPRFLNPL